MLRLDAYERCLHAKSLCYCPHARSSIMRNVRMVSVPPGPFGGATQCSLSRRQTRGGATSRPGRTTYCHRGFQLRPAYTRNHCSERSQSCRPGSSHHRRTDAGRPALRLFRPQKSGAVLGWEWAHDEPAPWLLRYIQDKDLWHWALPNSREISAALASYPFDFALWSSFQQQELEREGRAILRYENELVDKAGLTRDDGAV